LPYDPLEWVDKPLTERARMVCQAWAAQGYGAPPAVLVAYGLKVALYVGGWLFFCQFSPDLGAPNELGPSLCFGDWWLEPLAFQKAILFSMLFEGLGLGCGSGPLTGRYVPPVGGFLYWLRPGTTRLPVAGGTLRTWLDVGAYALLLGLLIRALISPGLTATLIVPIVVLVPLIGLRDRTIFLALRAEHYWVMAVCFLLDDWIAGAQIVALALWFFAGFSKLNHHFPAVVCVMTSNSPFTRNSRLSRATYRDYPHDLRPSRLAEWMAHAGTVVELAIPIILLLAPSGAWLILALVLATGLHTFIASNVPAGVPLEWNVAVLYGAFALFYAHPDVRVWDVSPVLGLFVLTVSVALPILGNLFPSRVPFLLAMRYYAGNWPYSVWLFRGDSYRKLERLTTSAPWVYDQLAHVYERGTSVGLVGKTMGFRMMHLQGRALPELIPRAVDRLQDYEYLEGEIVAGLVLGWNFGDGHLHQEALLASVQAQCGFEEGELRCIFVEAQPLGRDHLAWRIHDAQSGLRDQGRLSVTALRERQPWG
jgi:hypothetical protein